MVCFLPQRQISDYQNKEEYIREARNIVRCTPGVCPWSAFVPGLPLGVLIADHLSRKYHIDHIATKISKIVGIIA